MITKVLFGVILFFVFLQNFAHAQVSEGEMEKMRYEFSQGSEGGNALPLIEKVFQKDSNNWEALFMFYMVKTEYQSADSISVNALFKSVQINPEFDDSQHAIGLYYWYRDSLKLAYEHLTNTIRLNPKHFGAHYNRANVNFDLKKYKECLDDVKMSFQIEGTTEPYLLSTAARAYMELDDFPKAKSAIEWLLKTDNSPEYHQVYGEYYFKLKKYTSALQEYEISNQPEYDGGFGFLRIAKCYLALKNSEAACLYYNKARAENVPVQEDFEAICLDEK